MNHRTNLPSVTRLNIHYGIIQAIYWTVYASMTGFIVVLLQDRGFTPEQIGYLNAVRTCMAVLSQLFLAAFADHHKKFPLKYLIGIMMATCLIANLVFHIEGLNFAIVFLIFVVFGTTEMAIVSLMDSMAMQYINSGIGINYSACRGMGSITYAVTCLVLGQAANRWGTGFLIPLHTILILLYLTAVVTFPKHSAPTAVETEAKATQTSSFGAILQGNPRYAVYLVALMILFSGYMGIFTFMANVVERAGGDNGNLGTALFIYSVSQTPMMLFLFPILKKKYRAQHLLLFSSVVQSIHCLCLYAAASPTQIYLVQIMEMFAFGLYVPASVYYMNEVVPPADRIKGQTLAMTSTNLGATIGAAVFGVVIERFGVGAMLLGGNGMIIAGLILMALAFKEPLKNPAPTAPHQSFPPLLSTQKNNPDKQV